MKILRNRGFWVFFTLAVFSFAMTFFTHRGRHRFDWRSEFFADKAGYYIYLPATFFFHFDYDKVPPGLDQKTGGGFILDPVTRKIHTQYYYGEALLLTPFFLGTHAWSKLTGTDEENGFSLPYHRVMNYAAVVYLLIGLWFLRKFLAFYLEPGIAWFVVVVAYLGTNLLYYVMEDALMSHLFSFSVASVFLYLVRKFLGDTSRYGTFILMALVFAVLFIIRPTNSLFFLAWFFLDSKSWKETLFRVRLLFRVRHIFPLLLLLFLFALPQMLYWKYLFGSYLITSYGHTGFGNWDRPWFLEVWFSTLNGLFPWSPVLLFFVAGMVFMIVKRIPNGIFFFVFFFLVSYMAASWKYWYWGGAYGHRAFVEYYPLFSLPFGILVQNICSAKFRIVRFSAVFLICLFSFINFWLIVSILFDKNDKVFFGSTWDWPQYFRVWERAGLTTPFHDLYTFRNDFENEELARGDRITDGIVHRGVFSIKADPQNVFCCKFSKFFYDFRDRVPDSADIQFWIHKPAPVRTRALLVVSIQKDGTSFHWQSSNIDSLYIPVNRWTKIERTFGIPWGVPGDFKIFIYIWNIEKRTFYVDDMKIRFRKIKK